MATKASTSKSAQKTAMPVTGVTDENQTGNDDHNDAAPRFVRRKEFVDRIVASSGMKPNVVKTTLDAVLKELGDALSRGEALQLPPLGKLSVNRRKDLKNGEVLICKLRRRTPAEKTGAPLADTPEEG